MKTLVTIPDYLVAYSRGEISSGEAIRGIDAFEKYEVFEFRELLDLTLKVGLSLPRNRGREDISRKEVEAALPILRKQLELARQTKEKNNDQTDYSR